MQKSSEEWIEESNKTQMILEDRSLPEIKLGDPLIEDIKNEITMPIKYCAEQILEKIEVLEKELAIYKIALKNLNQMFKSADTLKSFQDKYGKNK